MTKISIKIVEILEFAPKIVTLKLNDKFETNFSIERILICVVYSYYKQSLRYFN